MLSLPSDNDRLILPDQQAWSLVEKDFDGDEWEKFF